ncbi:glycosyltransferase [Pedobacter sp. 22226]|uniref:glycosyltransferase n=1 Tax=Pedobacter sp. 22226 TaxID=3453894 RepID=UPI003F8721B0
MRPLVSILVPSYNHSEFITDTLDSVLEDTYSNKEIIIIDDGSKDNSKEIINKWISDHSGHNITFICRGNKGLCYTLNELVDHAKGEYVIVLASDDLLVNNTISERIDILSNSKKMALLSDAEVIDNNGHVIYSSMLSGFHQSDKTKYLDEQSLLDEIIFNFSISGAVIMMNINIFKIIGRYPEDLKAEDLYFYMSTAAENQLLFYDRIVSKYRIHGNNTSGENPELLIAVIKTYQRLLFKIPGVLRKLKLIKRIAGIILKTPDFNVKSLFK